MVYVQCGLMANFSDSWCKFKFVKPGGIEAKVHQRVMEFTYSSVQLLKWALLIADTATFSSILSHSSN